MAELTTTASAAVATGMTSAIVTGRPPQEIIVWALMGSLVAVWLDHQRGEAITVRWAAKAVGLIFVSVLSGIAGSAGMIALADIQALSFIAKIERWVLAFLIASLIHKLGPLAMRVISKKAEADDAVRP